MAQEDFDRFRLEVFRDSGLEVELREIVNRHEFLTRAVQIGLERGYAFTAKDVEEAMRAGRRAWMDRGV